MIEAKTSAKVIIVNDNDEVLVLFRSGTHPTEAHQADFPGGLMDEGEIERTTVVREVKEETAISIDSDDLTLAYAKTFFYDETSSITRLLYVAKLSETPSVLVSWEHEGYVWCPKNEVVKQYPLRTFYAEGLQYLLDHKLV